jgi:uncharacterized lipoprotein NlpE involved in copper resistance
MGRKKGVEVRKAIGTAMALVLVLAGCGTSSSPVATKDTQTGNTLEVPDGVFDVTANKGLDQCDSKVDYNGSYLIQIDGSTFTMGDDWTGMWDENNSLGSGSSPHQSETFRQCTISTWTSVNITFSSANEFTGSITLNKRVTGDCDTPCLSTWLISGTRRVDTP